MRPSKKIGSVLGVLLLALPALGAQTVGQQCQVGVGQSAATGDPLDGIELVSQDRLGVVQQSPDQGGLAVVD